MTNNFENNEHGDDFVEHEHEHGMSEEAAKPGIAGNLAEAWRTRPLFKFMVLLVAVFAVGVAGFSFLGGGSNSSNDISRLSRPPNMKEAPGGVVSPYMREQTELANKERSEKAVASGGSALPTPIGQTTDVSTFGSTDKKDDPLNELRAETEVLRKQVQQQQAQQQQQQRQQQPAQPEAFDNSLAEAMQRQMQQLLDGWVPKGIKNVVVIKPEDLKEQAKAAAAENAAAAGATTQASATEPKKLVVNAGTVSYAQLLTEANSDVPGPIMVQIVSGPLSGARAIGSFQVAMGYEKYLVLKFSLADLKGKDYSINAYALDPDTTLGGMATEVDERYFARVVLPAAAGFLQGLGQAMGQGNTSITTNGSTSISTTAGQGFRQGVYNGLGQGAQTMGQFFQDQANLTKPLVRVASGTPVGLFFVAPVFEPTDTTGQPTTNANGVPLGSAGYTPPYGTNPYGNNPYGGNPYGGNPYGNPYGIGASGYPGTTVNGYGNGLGQNAGAGVPYPNYSVPGYGYVHNPMTSNGMMNGIQSPYVQNYGQ